MYLPSMQAFSSRTLDRNSVDGEFVSGKNCFASFLSSKVAKQLVLSTHFCIMMHGIVPELFYKNVLESLYMGCIGSLLLPMVT